MYLVTFFLFKKNRQLNCPAPTIMAFPGNRAIKKSLSSFSFDEIGRKPRVDVLKRSESDIDDIKPKSRSFFVDRLWSLSRKQGGGHCDSSRSSSIKSSKSESDDLLQHSIAALSVEAIKQRWRNQQIAKQQELVREQGSFWSRLLHGRGNSSSMRRLRQ